MQDKDEIRQGPKLTRKKVNEILTAIREAEEESLEALEASGRLEERERARDLNESERNPYGQA